MEKLLDGVEVEWKALGEIGEVRMCKRILKEQTSDVGEIPFYKIGTFGKEPNSYISNKLFNEYKSKYNYPRVGEVLISASGTIGRAVIFDGKDAYFQDSNIVWIENDENLVLNKYLYCFYQIAKWEIAEGGTIQRLYNDNLKKTRIPIPCPDNPKKSLEIQSEIVRILDTFTALIAELTAELTARKKQYDYYRDRLLTFEEVTTKDTEYTEKVEWKTLGEVAEIGTGSHDTQDAIEDGNYTFYARGRELLKLNDFDFDETAIITAGDGAGVGKVYHYVQGKYALHQRAYRIVPSEIMEPRFVYHYIASKFFNYIQKAAVSSSVTSLRRPMFLNFPIPVPSFAEQTRIASILDKFDALTTSITEGLPREIELRQKQYEYYRDMLLSFPWKER